MRFLIVLFVIAAVVALFVKLLNDVQSADPFDWDNDGEDEPQPTETDDDPGDYDIRKGRESTL